MKWTEAREQVLIEHARLGAIAVKKELLKETGATTTTAAVIRHASRMGVSLARFDVCPRCGGEYPASTFSSDGLCRVCHIRELRDAYSKPKVSVTDTQKERLARREYDLARKRTSESVSSMNMSGVLSSTSSGLQKVLGVLGEAHDN